MIVEYLSTIRTLFLLFSACLFPLAVVRAEPITTASAEYPWSFPRDHGRHSGFATEWWYYTGQLYEEGKEPFRDAPSFGYQLTFFRQGVQVGTGRADEYMAHAALTDIARGKTFFTQRVGGGALGVAGVSELTLRAWSGDWSADRIELRDRTVSDLLRYSLPVGGALWFVRLQALANGEPWLQGEHGLSKKGECAGCASMYYSHPRMHLQGTIESPEVVRRVTGLGWMDHEFMSNALTETQAGWDWLSLMLRDGRRIMLFQIRTTNGGTPYISGAVHAGGAQHVLRGADVSMAPSSYWKSPRSEARYPLAWRIVIPSEHIDVEVAARVNDCELGGASSDDTTSADDRAGRPPLYWEGPISSADEGVIGYLEMTGYAQRIHL